MVRPVIVCSAREVEDLADRAYAPFMPEAARVWCRPLLMRCAAQASKPPENVRLP